VLLLAHIRRLQALDAAPLTQGIVVRAATERVAPSLAAVVVTAAALLPFALMGDVPGAEMAHTAAVVILGGLVSAAALTQLLLPALCLAFGPTAAISMPEPGDESPGAPPLEAPAPTEVPTPTQVPAPTALPAPTEAPTSTLP
jgi:hypothetical protein